MIFGSIDTSFVFDESKTSRNDTIYGAWMAWEGFYQALLKYGTFDEYHFFTDLRNISLIEKKLSRLSAGSDRVKVLKMSLLPFYLRKIKYNIFFTAGHFLLSELAYIRSQFASDFFPLCSMAHTVSYQFFLESVFFKNMISNLYSFDSIICTSRAQLKAIENLNKLVGSAFKKEKGWVLKYKGRLDHLPLGINLQAIGKVDKYDARRQLGLPANKIIILYFGRLSIYDKMDLYPLLLALKEILVQEKNIVLLVAGRDAQDNYSRKLKKIASDMHLLANMKFFLNPSINKKHLLYSASDIFVSPSDNIQESFGITNLEAMAAGLPVVVSDWDGYKDTIVHNQTGFLIPTYWADCARETSLLSPIYQDWSKDHLYLAQSVSVDIKKMIEYLLILIKNRELRLKFGRNARNRVREKYDWRVLIPKYENLWRQLFKLFQYRRAEINKNKTYLFVPDYFKCFAHYSSRILNNRTRIAITKNGTLLLKTRKMPHSLLGLKEKISLRIIFLILMFLIQEKSANMEAVERYIKYLSPMLSSDRIRYHIMWLLKKDLVRL